MKEFDTHMIQNILLDIGIPANLLGFMYLVYAMELALEDYEYIIRLNKLLYVDVAKRYHTEPICVDRCIRSAIEKTFISGNNICSTELFVNVTYKNVPTPTQFLSRMYFYIINNEHEKRLS